MDEPDRAVTCSMVMTIRNDGLENCFGGGREIASDYF